MRVAESVQIVIGNLEGEAYLPAEIVQGLGLSLGCIGNHGAHLHRAGQKGGRLEAYHIDIFFAGDHGLSLEFHIVLLTLANLCAHLGK